MTDNNGRLTRGDIIYILEKIGDHGNMGHDVIVSKLKNMSMDLVAVEDTQGLIDKRGLLE